MTANVSLFSVTGCIPVDRKILPDVITNCRGTVTSAIAVLHSVMFVHQWDDTLGLVVDALLQIR